MKATRLLTLATRGLMPGAPSASRLLVLLAVAAVYYATARFGLALAVVHPSASAVWPPTGIALAAVLVLGRWVWPAIALGAFAANVTTAGTVLTSLGIAFGNTGEAMLGAYLVERYASGRHALDRAPDIFRFAALGAMASTTVSATVGVASLSLGGLVRAGDTLAVWVTWWLGDATGAMIVAPFLLAWTSGARRLTPAELAEVGVVLGLLLVISSGVFLGILPGSSSPYPLAYACFPVLVWAAYRLGLRGAATAMLVLSSVAIGGTLRGAGPLVGGAQNSSLLFVQAFLGIAAVMTLSLASLAAERAKNESALRDARDEMERRVHERTRDLSRSNQDLLREVGQRERADSLFRIVAETANDGIVSTDAAGTIVLFNAAAERMFGHPAAEALRKSVATLFPERLHKTLRRGMARLQASGGERLSGKTTESIGRRKDGTEFPIEMSLSTRMIGGEALFTAVIRDVTRRRKAEIVTARFAAIVESSDTAILGMDPEGEIESWNPAAEELFGYSAEEAVGRNVAFLGPPGWEERIEQSFLSLRRGEPVEFEARQVRKDGTTFDTYVILSPVRGAVGKAIGYSAILRDITETKKAEQARAASEVLRAELDDLAARTREIALLNDMSSLLGAAESLAEAYPLLPRFLRDLSPGDSGALYMFGEPRDLLEAVIAWGQAPPAEDLFAPDQCWALRRGKLNWIADPADGAACQHLPPTLDAGSLCVPIVARGETLGVLHWRLARLDADRFARDANPLVAYRLRLARSVAEQLALGLANVKLHELLRAQASQDPLTGLYNRRHLEDALRREYLRAARRGAEVGVLIVDLDDFKRFNDAFGHDAGDRVLRDVGALLARDCRAEDIVCRYGGEEFMVVLPDCALEIVVQRAERIRHAIRALRIEHDGRQLGTVTASLGVASYPEHADSPAALVRAADDALYRSKAEGRDRVTVAARLQGTGQGGTMTS